MANLKDLILSGLGQVREAFLRVSGNVESKDYRAVSGDTIAKTKLFPKLRRLTYTADDNDSYRNPIIIDSVIMGTRKIIVNLTSNTGITYLPENIVIYDPDDWLSTFTASAGLDIYFIPLVTPISNDNGSIKFDPRLYCGRSVINVLTSNQAIEMIDNKYTTRFQKSFTLSNTLTRVMAHVSIRNSLNINFYDSAGVLANNLYEYLIM